MEKKERTSAIIKFADLNVSHIGLKCIISEIPQEPIEPFPGKLELFSKYESTIMDYFDEKENAVSKISHGETRWNMMKFMVSLRSNSSMQPALALEINKVVEQTEFSMMQEAAKQAIDFSSFAKIDTPKYVYAIVPPETLVRVYFN